jgi:hypothetical protein
LLKTAQYLPAQNKIYLPKSATLRSLHGKTRAVKFYEIQIFVESLPPHGYERFFKRHDASLVR